MPVFTKNSWRGFGMVGCFLSTWNDRCRRLNEVGKVGGFNPESESQRYPKNEKAIADFWFGFANSLCISDRENAHENTDSQRRQWVHSKQGIRDLRSSADPSTLNFVTVAPKVAPVQLVPPGPCHKAQQNGSTQIILFACRFLLRSRVQLTVVSRFH